LRKGVAFAAIAAASVAVAVGSVAWAVKSPPDESHVTAQATIPSAATPATTPTDAFVVFQHLGEPGSNTGTTALAVRGAARGRATVGRSCERSHFAKNLGLCLIPAEAGLTFQYDAMIVDRRLRVRDQLTLAGIITRTRVSADARYGAATGFVTGHSYAQRGFSTATFLIDLETGVSIGNLEKFTVIRDGKRIESPDFNFWGVTFRHDDSNRFYATLATRGRSYLVEGSIAERRVRIIHDRVECPSLSPDDRRIAFKRAVRRGIWQLTVLDLATMRETRLAETRSVDDQVEWLDNRRILYGLNRSIWTVPADGSGRPVLYLQDAASPAVIHPT
jgi:hypothetical protein